MNHPVNHPVNQWHRDAQPVLSRLQTHGERLHQTTPEALFAAEANRFDQCSLLRSFSCPGADSCNGQLLADWSREPLDAAAWEDLLQLPDAVGLGGWIERLFAGETVNPSEQLPASAPACRAAGAALETGDCSDSISEWLQQMLTFAEDFRSGNICGSNGTVLQTLVNIGIGGSDQGGRLIRSAFADDLPQGVQVLFACCEEELEQILPRQQAEKTLFLLNSKSFTTLEMLRTAEKARQWLQQSLGDRLLSPHLAAATSQPQKAKEAGIASENIFQMPEGAGGRYSLWSSSGLAAAAVLGRNGFLQLLSGGRCADAEFRQTHWAENLPVRLALKDLWHQGIARRSTRLLMPYSLKLADLPDYLGQLEMESLGKNLSADGDSAVESSGQMVWGSFGPKAQHSFYQLLYQGTHRPQVEMIAIAADPAQDTNYAQCLAQAQALASGIEENPLAGATEINALASASGIEENTLASGTEINPLASGIEENPLAARQPVPVTVQVLRRLNPCTLGFLLACWEHRVYTQSRVLNINPFDQPGVEYGKKLTASLDKKQWQADHPATSSLVEFGRNRS